MHPKESQNHKKIIFYYLTGIAIGMGLSVILLLLCACLLTFTDIDRAFCAPLSTICVAVGTFFAALFAAKKIGDKGYRVGGVVGLITFCVVTLAAWIVSRGNFSENTGFHFIILTLSGLVGGIIGVNRKEKRYH